MDREQALEIIKAYKQRLTDSTSNQLDGDIQAFETAIEALEQQPCENTISREDVLDEINRIGVKAFETYNDYSELFDFVDSLPSVNPQTNKEDIHREREQAYMRGYEDAGRKYRIEPCTNIPFLLHKEFGCPLDECVKAYEKANEYLRSKSKLKG